MIAFHGTNKKSAIRNILKKGFKRGTYFAYEIENAVEFGGDYIFIVRFSDDSTKWHGAPDRWQFHLGEVVSPNSILAHFSLKSVINRQVEHALQKLEG